MSRSRTAPWVAGTVVAAVLIMVAAWFLAISPRMVSAADTRDRTVAQQARIDQLDVQLAGLKRDFANIEEFRTELADLRVQIPNAVELSDLTRELADLAQQSQVFVVALNPATPLQVVPVTPVVATPVVPADSVAPTDGATPADGATGTTDGTTTAAPVVIEGFYAVPFEIIVLGGYTQTTDFIARLQTQNPRLLVVTGLMFSALGEAGAQAGRPAVAAGDLETSIKAYAYVLLDAAGTVTGEVSQDATAPDVLPTPAVPRNPLAPAT